MTVNPHSIIQIQFKPGKKLQLYYNRYTAAKESFLKSLSENTGLYIVTRIYASTLRV